MTIRLGGIAPAAACLALLFVPQPPLAAPPPGEILLAPFKDGVGKTIRIGLVAIQKRGFEVGKRLNVTNSPADDDAPCFVADSSALLFSSSRDGAPRDIYRYDIATKTVTQITKTVEDESAPVLAPDGRTFTAIRGADRRLWRFNLDGSDADREPLHSGKVADYAWMSLTRIAAFVRSPQGGSDVLHLVNLETRADDSIESVAGRSVHVRPDTNRLTFMYTSKGGRSVIGEFNPSTKKLALLADAVEGSVDHAWTPSGRLIAGAGWSLSTYEEETDRWIEVADLRKDGFTGITRVAISPDGLWIAIVATPAVK